MSKLLWHRFGLNALLVLMLSAACGAPVSSISPTASTSGNTTSSSGAAPADAAQGSTEADGDAWSTLVAAAQKEGHVVLTGTLLPDASRALGDAFHDRYGISVNFQAMDTAAFLARADQEFKAGAVSFDAAFGVSNCYVMADRGEIESMNGVLMEPDAINPTAWKNGAPRLFKAGPTEPPDFICGSQFGEQVQPQLFVNPDVIPPGSISTWDDLLQPAYKDKITGHDPRIGGGGQGRGLSIMYVLGEDYFVKLYQGQNVMLSRDYRQVTDWVVHGEYPIGLGISDDVVATYRDQGLPIERVFPANGPDALTAGSGAISLMKNAPDPNAAKLFANWLHTREGPELWEQHEHTPSLRTDTDRQNVVEWVIPRSDVTYKLHDGDPDFYYQHRAPLVLRIQELLGR